MSASTTATPDAARAEPRGPAREIFAVGRGQYENIGDVLLRRPLLDWARGAGRLHVYVGDSPDGYDEGLGLGPDDIVYRSFASWYLALLRAGAAGRAHSLFKPGEIQLTLVGMKEHVVMLPAVALVRARGGIVARVGAGARNFAPLPRALMWPSNALSSFTRWRDDQTAAYLGFGPAMPDLGYAEGMADEQLRAERDAQATSRNLMVLSLRDDVEVAPRPYPRPEWLAGIRAAAGRLGLGLCVVTQVQVDDERSRRLAADLDAELVAWPDLADHAAQERRLRAVYRRAAVVASDRLHILIAGLTEGAVPVGLEQDDDGKIARHFDAIGIADVGVKTSTLTGDELSDRIVATSSRRREMLTALLDARAELAEVRGQLQSLLATTVAAGRAR